MNKEHSPIIPRQFIPVLENALDNDPCKAAFLVKAILSNWRGDAEMPDVPPEYCDAWLALRGNLDTINAKIEGGKKGGRPSTKTSGAEGFFGETSDARIVEDSEGEMEDKGSDTPLLPPEGGETDGEEFEIFWKAYGKRGPRKAAEAAFAKAKDSPTWPGIDRICEILAVFKASGEWTRDEGRFQPHASKWLNEERWNDELPPMAQANAERQAWLERPAPQYDL